jgi:chromosome partitioning protein
MRYIDEKLTAREQLSKGRDEFIPDHALRRLLEKHNVHKDYTVLIVDPPTKPSPELRNAMFATRNILSPLEVSSKGETSIRGVRGEKKSLENDLGIQIGVHGIVPNGVDQNSNISEEAYNRIRETQDKVLAPIEVRERGALFSGAWDAHMSAFSFAEREKDRLYNRDRGTLKKLQYLADTITDDVDQTEGTPEDMEDVVKRPTQHRIHDDFKQDMSGGTDTATGDD